MSKGYRDVQSGGIDINRVMFIEQLLQVMSGPIFQKKGILPIFRHASPIFCIILLPSSRNSWGSWVTVGLMDGQVNLDFKNSAVLETILYCNV